MRKRTRLLIIRWVTFALMIIIINILQNTQGFFPEIFGVRAFLLIPATVCIGMFERKYAGAFFGLFAGALWDTVTPLGDGYNAFVLMLFGAVCGLLITVLMRNHLLTALILSFGASVLYALLYVIFFIVAQGMEDSAYLFFRYYLTGAVYTALFTPVFYIFVMGVVRATTVEEKY
ncbi:MAG: rod shape-determining protein MreD [Ruminococcaceae bacterium]|nr:rod shape-determining protein MreD [Oscillospiraceae bacterium]